MTKQSWEEGVERFVELFKSDIPFDASMRMDNRKRGLLIQYMRPRLKQLVSQAISNALEEAAVAVEFNESLGAMGDTTAEIIRSLKETV